MADDEPDSWETLAAYAAGGRSWLAHENDDPIGYVVVDIVGAAPMSSS